MSKNIDQIFIANPITSNAATDLMYFGQSPYGVGNDAAMTYANFSAQFGAPYTAAALTKTDDTNVTLTLGGSPTTALLHATSLTLGWTGTLSGTRGGTGVNNGSNTATFAGNLNFANSFTTSGNFAVTQTYTGVTNVTFPTSGTLATTSQLPTPAALTKVDDTNVTLTLGGTPATALLQATSITAGWAGQLAVGRGGTGAASYNTNGVVISNTTSTGALAALSLTDGQVVIGSSAGAPSASTLTAGTGISITNGHNSITIAASGGSSVTPANIQQQAFSYAVAGGTGNAITATLSPAISSLTAGSKFDLLITANNTGATTLDVGTGAQFVTYANGFSTDLIGGELVIGQIASFEFDGSEFQLLNPSTPVYTNGARSIISQGVTLSSVAGDSLAVGLNALASGNSSVAVGQNSQAGGMSAVALGNNAHAGPDNSVAIGTNATSFQVNAVAIGAGTVSAFGNSSYALGNGASCSGDYSYGLGLNAATSNNGSFVFVDSSGAPANDTANNQFMMTFAGGYYFNLTKTNQVAAIDTSGNIINKKGTADQSYSLQAPTTGFSITIGAGVKSLVLNPGGTLATGTIVMPASPIDGQEIRVSSSQTITALTVSANTGQTISNAPTTLTAGTGFAYIYNLSGTNWFRLY
jgi:hypothetical protein